MRELSELELDLLREMNGERRGLCYGAAVMEMIGGLWRLGLVARTESADGITYRLSESGQQLADSLR